MGSTIEFCIEFCRFSIIGPNFPKKCISCQEQKNCTFAYVHSRYLQYQTFPHGCWQTQRHFKFSSFSSRRDKNLNKKNNVRIVMASDCSALYRKFSHDKPLKVMRESINFPFDRGTKMYVAVNKFETMGWKNYDIVLNENSFTKVVINLLDNGFLN